MFPLCDGCHKDVPDRADGDATFAPGILVIEALHLRPPFIETAHPLESIPDTPQGEAACLDVPVSTSSGWDHVHSIPKSTMYSTC